MNNNERKDTNNTRGGTRVGAGRKVGTGKFGEPTEVLRIPSSQKAVISDFLAAYQRKHQLDGLNPVSEILQPVIAAKSIYLPLFGSKVPAGFPSPADDHVEKRLDANEYLIDQEDATFFVTIQGESMINAGLLSGDKAVVDRSKQASVGDIVMAVVDGEFTIKTLGQAKSGMPRLLPANPAFNPIEIKEEMQFEIWGVVTGSFRRFK
ncbi:MAG: translesion error-prone DNA polymerase V autoproteolytic subunit [Methylophilaceae bacterium]|nr:translesion error-prone DNA polymerase V autoproteolytic subunit [Methylophilaceae bacterium]MDG1445480.1 translesion error-prone DNA polymerase V autoproteolytic subunit [Methylophilaceae bacterium]